MNTAQETKEPPYFKEYATYSWNENEADIERIWKRVEGAIEFVERGEGGERSLKGFLDKRAMERVVWVLWKSEEMKTARAFVASGGMIPEGAQGVAYTTVLTMLTDGGRLYLHVARQRAKEGVRTWAESWYSEDAAK